MALHPRTRKVGRSSFTLTQATLLHPRRQSVLDVIDKTVNPRKSSSSHLRKKLLSYGIAKENLNKIYLLPFKATKEVKLAIFQHKIIHNILATNSILYKMKKVASPSYPFCPSDSPKMHHLFISCPQAYSFWDKFQTWYSTVSNAHILLSEPEVLFGVTLPCNNNNNNESLFDQKIKTHILCYNIN